MYIHCSHLFVLRVWFGFHHIYQGYCSDCQSLKSTLWIWQNISYTVYPKNTLTVFALLCFVVVIHWLIFPYPSGLLHWHCGNLTIAPVPAKQPWWIWINTSWEFIMNDCITTTKQSTTKPCAYFLGYTVHEVQVILIPKGFNILKCVAHQQKFCFLKKNVYCEG